MLSKPIFLVASQKCSLRKEIKHLLVMRQGRSLKLALTVYHIQHGIVNNI